MTTLDLNATSGATELAALPQDNIPGYPYEDVVLIEAQTPTGVASATGFAIGPHTIMTAAHVVRDAVDNINYQNFCLFPGYTSDIYASKPAWGDAESVTIAGASGVHYDPNWTMNANGSVSSWQSQYDIAIIDTGLITFQTWFDIGPAPSLYYDGVYANITGYPAHDIYGNGQYFGGHQNTNYNIWVTADINYYTYTYPGLTTFPGNSGGPLWMPSLDSNGRYQAIGLVSSGSPSECTAARFNQSDLTEVQNWMSSDGYLLGYKPPSFYLYSHASVAKGHSLLASAFVSGISNPSGDVITLIYNNDAGGSGYFTVNGVAQSNGRWIYPNPGDTVLFVAGNTPGTDTVEVGLYDYTYKMSYYGQSPISVTTRCPPDDFNVDGYSDVLWRNSNGDAYLWLSNGSGGFSGYRDLGIVGLDWRIAGACDFTGDGASDILWRNSNGDAYLWLSNGSGGVSGYRDLGIVGSDWQIAGVGDFNADGRSDILWRNTANGDVALWDSDGSGGLSAHYDLGVVATSWQIDGVGDFNRDGKSDILWRNAVSGDVALWNSDGSGGLRAHYGFGVVGLDWQIASVGDFNGDSCSDILWRNSNGDVYLWQSNGAGGNSAYQDLGMISTSWHISAVEDLNSDSRADVLWTNDNGDRYLWMSKASGGFNYFDLGFIGTDWTIQHA